ncbi:CHASE2 domain-containing protein [filamentous cyanobacterium LEGE 11480]|uniref:CHASE2 domain-containing protein n=1 Tax=Romeriopsis navalis LEGE 11480 TaxID=2777977 RepID=A0A928Z4B7_9CYAN|nr:CHASE2 domain-containing protein [Romeriopsis navalis]MBE9032431.1 CHASE2 domain-containing protein [Romeriopsis navalis LEGE 11480]
MQDELRQRLKRGLDRWQISLLPGVATIGIVIALRWFGVLQGVELAAFDRWLRWRPAEPMDDRVLIIGINEQDIQQLKRYPVSDKKLADTIEILQQSKPAVIGIDIFRDQAVPPGSQKLKQLFANQNNLIGIDKIVLAPGQISVKPPPTISSDRVGFADAALDPDGALRRSLIYTVDDSAGGSGEVRASLSMVLAERYLGSRDIEIREGTRDPDSIRIGNVELPQMSGRFGGYSQPDQGGLVGLINFRSGRKPFRVVSLADVSAKRVKPEWIQGKVVLIGITASSVRDYVNSKAVQSSQIALLYGVEAQAHTVSQLISAGEDGRPFIQAWSDPGEYLWICLWGGGGILLGWVIRSPFKWLGLLVVGVGSLLLVSYGAIVMAWWIPVVPPLLVFLINGAGLTAFYRYDQGLRERLQERQLVIDEAFNAIHNGPLQVLSELQRRAEGDVLQQSEMLGGLQELNRSIRGIYESMQSDALSQPDSVYISETLQIDLREPLHEVLQQVYSDVLERQLPHFATVKAKIVNFEPFAGKDLSVQSKRDLCRFLEEALCNVGKHAQDVTRLEIFCGEQDGQNVIRVSDNGQGQLTEREGIGTKQSKKLARQLKGKFQRSLNSKQGIACQLVWPIR